MLPAIGACLVVSFAIACAGTAALVWLGRRARLLDTPGARGHEKLIVHPTPNIGGVAIVLGVALPMIAALVGARWADAAALAGCDGSGWLGDALASAAAQLPGIADRTPMALALIGCLLGLHVVGLIDDRRALPWWPKLGAQFLAAGVLVLAFPELRLLQAVDAWVGGSWLSMLLAVLWLVAISNAMNFMDNMDGLAGGAAAVAASFFLLAAWMSGQWFVASVLALLLGSLLGFLVFNFPWPTRQHPAGKARIFMGDGGSLVVGFLLAFLTVRTTYFDPARASDAAQVVGTAGMGGVGRWWAVLAPLCVLAVPLYDMVSVSALRISQGKSPLVGDQQHFSHRLRRRGLTVRQTLAVVYACTAITGIAGVLLTQLRSPVAWLVGVQVALVLLVLGVWELGSTRANGANAEAGPGRSAP